MLILHFNIKKNYTSPIFCSSLFDEALWSQSFTGCPGSSGPLAELCLLLSPYWVLLSPPWLFSDCHRNPPRSTYLNFCKGELQTLKAVESGSSQRRVWLLQQTPVFLAQSQNSRFPLISTQIFQVLQSNSVHTETQL